MTTCYTASAVHVELSAYMKKIVRTVLVEWTPRVGSALGMEKVEFDTSEVVTDDATPQWLISPPGFQHRTYLRRI